VTVTYTASHQIFVNSKQVSEEQLGSAIHDLLAHMPDKVVVFDGDPRVILGDMVRILDIAKGAGADKVALAIASNSGGTASADEPGKAPAEPEPESVAPAEGGMP
jgi:biopolymer transport protein ExbD